MANDNVNAAALGVWETIAPDWDAAVGPDGNLYWEVLEEPYLARLLQAKKAQPAGKTVRALDISTGNGLTARWLASFLGSDGAGGSSVDVTGVDGSEPMLAQARRRTAEWAEQAAAAGDGTPPRPSIRFAKLDVSKPADFEPFIREAEEESPFDVVLMNMAIMDVPTLEPLAAALPKLLAKDGVFVGSLLHPVFFTSRAHRTIEVIGDYDAPAEHGGASGTEHTNLSFRHRMTIERYMHVPPFKGYAIAGQQAAQFYFHRPLHELFGTFLKGGKLALDGLEEPVFEPLDAETAKTARLYSTRHFTEFPQILMFRLRRVD